MLKKYFLVVLLVVLCIVFFICGIICIHIEIEESTRLILLLISSIGLLIALYFVLKQAIYIYTYSVNGKLRKLIDLIDSINEDTSFDGILDHMFYSFKEYIPYVHIGIALLKNDGRTLEASYGISDPSLKSQLSKLIGTKVNMYNTTLYKIVESGDPRIINDLESYTNNPKAEYNKILLSAGIKSSITYPLKISNNLIGIIFFSCNEKNRYNNNHLRFLKTLSNSMALSLYKNLYIEELLFTQVLALARLAEARDEDTGEHLERMKQYSAKIAEILYKEQVFPELTNSLLKGIEKYAPLHDIGKVGIRDGILLKPGKLTEEEFAEMKMHTIFGAEVIQKAEGNMLKFNKSLFKVGIEIALSHHEKWDGSGYPYQKSGEEIPLSARIVAVADVLDALTSKRPYKEAYGFDESMDIIIQGRGKHFDPRVIDCVVNHRNDLYALYKQFKNQSDSN